jgi:hypothetical protein
MRPASVFLIAIFLAGAVRGADLTAVLSEVEGNVTVKEETPPRQTVRSGPSIRLARFLQVVRVGDEIRVPTGAGAGLVCSNDRWVSLSEGIESRLTKDLCLKGKELPPGTYRKLAPVGGRMPSIAGALVLERKTRAPEDEDFGVPLLLSPRNTSLLDPRPEIVWTPVPGAVEYEIKLVGVFSFRLLLDTSDLPCTRSGEDWGEPAVCFMPWPASAPDLPRGETFFLRVGARRGLASPLREGAEPSQIQRLTEEGAEEVQLNLERVRDLPLGCEARHLLEADIYAQAGVLSAAIPAYRKALRLRDTPESWITLGDLYFASGLFRSAARSYQSILDSGLDATAQAAAELGLGRVEYVYNSLETAVKHFSRSRYLYDSVGLKDEAEAAGRNEGLARTKE